MIISCIHIQSFGKINNLTLELDGGINIITGENESGKSTICNFIKFVFLRASFKNRGKAEMHQLGDLARGRLYHFQRGRNAVPRGTRRRDDDLGGGQGQLLREMHYI